MSEEKEVQLPDEHFVVLRCIKENEPAIVSSRWIQDKILWWPPKTKTAKSYSAVKLIINHGEPVTHGPGQWVQFTIERVYGRTGKILSPYMGDLTIKRLNS